MKRLQDMIVRTLDDGLLVARPGGHRLFVLNSSARFIWELLVERVEESRIPQLMVDRYGIELELARRDFDATLARWRVEGLIGPTGPRRDYVIGGVDFSIEFGNAHVEAVIAPVFAHLQSMRGRPSRHEGEFTIDVEDGRFALRKDGVDLRISDSLGAILEKLTLNVVMTAYDKIEWLVTVHSAAVGNAKGCIIMPGVSGIGKSTLTAWLVSQADWRYLTDDVVLLHRDDLRAVPMPGAIVLKRGSWEPLVALANGLPTHRRFDSDVKYWAPPADRVVNVPLPVRAVVFPRREEGARARLASINPLQGLSRVLAAPTTLSPPMTSETVDQLLQWATRTPFYDFTFGLLEDTPAALRPLLAP